MVFDTRHGEDPGAPLTSPAAAPAPWSPPHGGKARRTCEALVEAVAEEIRATGSFTAERAAARAGASPATFYAYLPSKEAALAAAFSRVLDRLSGEIAANLDVERLLEHGLPRLARDLVSSGLAFFTAEARVFRLALAQLPESAALRAIYREHEAAAFARYRRFLALGAEAGKLRRGDADALARALMVVTQGLNNPIALRCEEGDPLVDELAAVVVGLLAPKESIRVADSGRRARRTR
jgi:AcrR family transcriptional regulator